MLHKRWDLASDEQKARIAQIKAQTDKLKGTDNEEELSRLDQVLSEIKGLCSMPFSDKQQEFFQNANHRWNVKVGATRSGKTYMDYYVIPKRIRARRGKEGLVAILGVSKGTIQRNIIEPLQRIWGANLVGDINSQNICPMFGEDVYCLGAEKVSQVSKIRGSSLKYCYGDEVVDWNPDVFNMLKSRLDKPYSCFDGACNPDAPQHWFKSSWTLMRTFTARNMRSSIIHF